MAARGGRPNAAFAFWEISTAFDHIYDDISDIPDEKLNSSSDSDYNDPGIGFQNITPSKHSSNFLVYCFLNNKIAKCFTVYSR